MKPLRLEMSAFGPYAHQETVDFGELAGRKLFLIHGPTGAGKTSILDAICFAIFGDASGGDRDPGQLRSQHADPKRETEVTLEFTLGKQSYRVVRRPRQTVAKKRGEGTTERPPKATLFKQVEKDGRDDWEPIVEKTGEVTRHMEELLGFKSDQFRQVILLPQGEFRKFLFANSADRQAILETAFGTGVYDRIQKELAERAGTLEKDAKAVTAQMDFVLQEAGVANVHELRDRHTAAQGRLAAAEAVAGKAHEAVETARAADEAAAALESLFDQRDAATAEAARLAEQRQEIENLQEKLAAGEKADRLADAFDNLRGRRDETAEAEKRLAGSRQAVAKATEDHAAAETAAATVDADRQRVRGLEQELDRLADAVRLAQALAAADRQCDAAAAAAAAAQRQVRTLVSGRETAAVKADRLAETLRQTRETAARQPAVAAELRHAGERLRLADRLHAHLLAQEKLEADCGQATEARGRAEQAQRHAAERLHRARRRRDEDAAAMLAASLTAGRGCPVCGSTEHPRPARPSDAAVPTPEQLDRLAAGEADAADDLAQADQRLRRLEVRRESGTAVTTELRGQLADAADGDALRREVERLRRESEEVAAAAARVESLAEQHRRTQQADERLAGQVRQAEDEVARCATAVTAARTRRDTVREQLPEDRRDLSALEARRGAAAAERDRLATAADRVERRLEHAGKALSEAQATVRHHEQDRLRAAERFAEAQRSFAGRLADADFADEEAFRAALLHGDDRRTYEDHVRRHREAVHNAEDRRGRTAAAIGDRQRPDRAAGRQAHQDARAAEKDAIGAARDAGGESGRVTDWLARHEAQRRRRDAMAAAYEVGGKLAKLARGDNSQKLPFKTFVLAGLFEDILRLASRRLQVMSHRRYTLKHQIAHDDGRRIAGLEMSIHDAYTDSQRPVKTLSGGESFLASLALALGLADVVQAHAGGIYLDTVFIDEGFGTLDPESLDQAMQALTDLQRTGDRMVGIISHVPELRERIDACLEIVKGRAGSTTRFRVG